MQLKICDYYLFLIIVLGEGHSANDGFSGSCCPTNGPKSTSIIFFTILSRPQVPG
jgi:hypothetical protein